MDPFKLKRIRVFKDLDVEGFIYRINPYTLKVEGLKIRDIHGIYDKLVASKTKHPTPWVYKEWVEIIVYMPDARVHSTDLDAIPTIRLWLDGSKEIMLTIMKNEDQSQLPVPVGATRKALEEWMQRTG